MSTVLYRVLEALMVLLLIGAFVAAIWMLGTGTR